MVTPAGRLVRINAAAERITGFSTAEVLDRSIFSALLVAEEVADCSRPPWPRWPRAGPPQKLEGWVLTKFGDRRRIAWTCASSTAAGRQTDDPLHRTSTSPDLAGQDELAEPAAAATSSGRRKNTPGNWKKSAAKSPGWKALPGATAARPPSCRFGDNSRNERRTAERRPYPYVQLLAPVTGNQSPAANGFRKSPLPRHLFRRLLLLRQKPPKTKRVMAAFGVPGSLTYLAAEIVHCRHVADKQMYLVGCRYIGRADYD